MAFLHLTSTASTGSAIQTSDLPVIRYKRLIFKFFLNPSDNQDQYLLKMYQPYYIRSQQKRNHTNEHTAVDDAFTILNQTGNSKMWRNVLLFSVWVENDFLTLTPIPRETKYIEKQSSYTQKKFIFYWVILQHSRINYGTYNTFQLYQQSEEHFTSLRHCALEGLKLYHSYNSMCKNQYKLYVYGQLLHKEKID